MSDSRPVSDSRGFLAWWRRADYGAKAGVIGTVIAAIALVWGFFATGGGDCTVDAADSNVACGDLTVWESE